MKTAILFCVFATFLLIGEAHAATIYQGMEDRRWPRSVISWWYNPTGQVFSTEQAVSSIKKAARAWQKDSNIRFIYKGITYQSLSNRADDKLVIGWLDERRFKVRFGDFSAYSRIWWNRQEVYDGEVSINKGVWKSDDIYAFQGVITHELGHLVGLDHSDQADSVMYFPYHKAGYQRTLKEDDINGARSLYPLRSTATSFTQDKYYGALAYYKGHYAYSYAYKSQAAASQRARRECGEECDIIIKITNECMALAEGSGTSYGWGTNSFLSRAKNRALEECQLRSRASCQIKVAGCTEKN